MAQGQSGPSVFSKLVLGWLGLCLSGVIVGIFAAFWSWEIGQAIVLLSIGGFVAGLMLFNFVETIEGFFLAKKPK